MDPHTIPDSWIEPSTDSHPETAEAVRRIMEWVFRDATSIRLNGTMASKVFGKRAMVIAVTMYPELFGSRQRTRQVAERIGLNHQLIEHYRADLKRHFGIKRSVSK